MSNADSDQVELSCSLTLEDEFILTQIKNKAIALTGKDREQYLWNTILKFISKERAYKSVLNELGISVNMNISDS